MQNIPRSDRDSARHSARIEFARDQRKQANECALDVWQMLRASRIRGKKFRREYPIPPYTVDFVCIGLKLIVEVDGKDHFTEEERRSDATRDRFLRDKGFEVLRIDGYQVTQDPLSAKRRIEEAVEKQIGLQKAPAPPAPLPQIPRKLHLREIRGRGEPE